MKTGIYEIPHEEYLKKHGLSCSGLKNFAKSPENYKYWIENTSEPTIAMQNGTHIHTAVLEPTRYREQYVVSPKFDRRTKAGKAEWAEFQEHSSGKTIITIEQSEMIESVVESTYFNKTAMKYLKSDLVEKSISWVDPDFGVECKGRVDILQPETGTIVDLKTTSDASPDAFSRALLNFKYHWQAAFYLRGMDKIEPFKYDSFVFICVETKPPYSVAVYNLDTTSIEIGTQEMLPYIQEFSNCLEHDSWPGMPDCLQEISVPGWYVRKFEYQQIDENMPF